MRRTNFKKVLSLVLSILMVITAIPMAAMAKAGDFIAPDNMYEISNTRRTIAPGVTENKLITNNKSGNKQVTGYAVTVDMSQGSTASFMTGYADYDSSKWKLQTVRNQATQLEQKKNVNVVAGFNADIYNMQTAEPINVLIMDGKITKNKDGSIKGLNGPYFALMKDGSTKIGSHLTTEIANNAKEAVGGFFTLLENGQRTGQGWDQSDLNPRTAVGIKADGNVVVYVADGRNAPISEGLSLYDLTSIMIGFGCVDVINLDGGGSTTYAAKYEGSDELVVANRPSDGAERNVASSLFVVSSAKPTGVFDHASVTPNDTLYTPESVVDFSVLGVDSAGGKADLPQDGKFALDSSSASLGTITEDGKFTSNGTVGEVKVNYTSGGAVCGTASIFIQAPDTFYVPTDEVSLGFEETTDFGIVAKYKDRIINMKAGDIEWKITNTDGADISGQGGTFDGLTFTTFDGVTINAIVTATSKHNPAVSATIKAVIGAMPVIFDDFEYTTDKAEAEANPALKYVPSTVMPKYDNVNYPGGHSTQVASIYEAGYPYYTWPNKSLGFKPEYMTAEIVSKKDGEHVRFGDHSMKVTFDFSGFDNSSNGNCYLRTALPGYTFEGSPTKFGAWIYIPEGIESALHIYLQVANKSGSTSYGEVGTTRGWTGWRYVELDLTNANAGMNLGMDNAPFGQYQGNGVLWISYQPKTEGALKAAASIYIDNMQLVYGANVDDIDNPIVKTIKAADAEIVDGETVLNSNINTFRASYADADGKYATGIKYNEVKMLLDGVDVTDRCFVNEHDEEIYFYDAELSNGTHSIEIKVADNFGNTSSETRYFTVKGEAKTTGVSLEALDKSPVLGAKYTLAVVSDNVTNVKSADVSIKVLSSFVQYWNKAEVVAGKDYQLDAPATYDTTSDTVNFRVSRKDAAAFSLNEEDIIAKIMFNIPNNVPEGLEVTYRVTKGALTLVDAVGEKYVSGFSGRIKTTCTSPFVITNDAMVVGSEGGNVYVKDLDGNAVEGVNIYTAANELVGVTDAEGKVFTDKFVSAVQEIKLYAEKDGQLSFILSTQSYPCGGDESGAPTFVKLNASVDPSKTQSISWMASPLNSKAKAIVEYATKADYEAKGEAAFTTFEGNSMLKEMNSAGAYPDNYAVRVNNATVTGLKGGTEYAYRVGDGEKMSDVKFFSTTRKGEQVNFFVIGDTQATDTTNTDQITKNLAESGVKYNFGIQTGDAVDNGGNYTMWANIAKVFSGDFLGGQDLIQVLGNHEYYGDDTAANAAAYFNLPGTKGNEAPPYYSVQYGNVYVAVINYIGMSGYREAAKWLVEDAKAAKASWKILTMHQPAYFTNPAGTSEEFTKVMTPAIDEAGINVVFSGHDHSYARTQPMKNGEVNNNGATYYICGSTGEKSYKVVKNENCEYAMIVEDYNAIYLTVHATDEELEITTREYTSGGEDVILDSCTITNSNDCSTNGHLFVYADGYLTCSECGFSKALGKYTGFATNEATGSSMYFVLGVARTGWQTIGDDAYYFDEKGVAVTGEKKITHHDKDGKAFEAVCNFDETGRQIGAAFVKDANGVTRAYRGGALLKNWQKLNGDYYYFSRNDGAMRTGKTTITLRTGQKLDCVFSKDGKLTRGCLYKTEDGTVYYWGSEMVSGWETIDGEKYYFMPDTHLMAIGNVTIDGKEYGFDDNGILRHEGFHKFGDDWTLKVIEPNCTVNGKKVYVCSDCYSTIEEVIPALGHIDGDGDEICDVCSKAMDYNSKVDNFAYKLFSRIMNMYKSIIKVIKMFFSFIGSAGK